MTPSPSAAPLPTITLRCRGCKRVEPKMGRAPWDPPTAVIADVLCPECASGAMEPPTFYFDAQGNEITADPEATHEA